MTKPKTSKLERMLIAVMLAAAVVSLLSIWSEDWFDIPGGPVRIGAQVVIIVLAGVFFWVRRSRKA